MTIAPGTRLGPYELDSRIGAGGMGEVWRARDTRLDRRVAIKLLSVGFAADPQSQTRFEREARTISQLEHPNICRLYDVGEARGHDGAPVPYLVTELLDGETLRAKLGGPANGHGLLSVRKALDYAGQLAEGLAAAHERGIVHRDLKPENVFITRDGRVKVIDFGIAKPAPVALAGATAETAAAATLPGVVIGTVAYMSPEQIRAADVDHRSDLFSLGVVLFEMVSGIRPFEGGSPFETMHAILTNEPPPLADGSSAPLSLGLSTMIGQLLEKEPQQRFQSARDLTFALQALSISSGTTPAPTIVDRRAGAKTLAIAAAAVIGLVGGAGVMRWMAPPVQAPPHVLLKRLTFESGVEQHASLAPDGKTFVFVSGASGNGDIYLQRVDGRKAINLTEQSTANDTQPAFSPDGSQIAFRSARDGGGIFIMGATGERVRRLTTVGFNPTWAPDGSRIAFSMEPITFNPRFRSLTMVPLWTADAQSGATRQITTTLDAVQPSWSPNGHRIAFWGLRNGSQRDLWTIDPNAADPDASAVSVTNDASLDWNPIWSADGKWLYFGSDRGGTLNLWRIAIDERTGVTRGAPEPVTLAGTFPGHFSLARQTNSIIFTGLEPSSSIERLALDALDAPPAPVLTWGLPITSFEVSPDGGRIAFAATNGAHEDLFVMNSDGRQIEPITDDEHPDRGPAWSSDGTSLYFYSERDGRYESYSIRSDGGGLTQMTRTSGFGPTLPRPSPDGSLLLVQNNEGNFLWNVRAAQPQPLPPPAPGRVVSDGRWSPDGRQIVAFENPADNLDRTLGIVLYDVGARTWRRIGNDPAFAFTWLTDRTIAFAASGALTVLDLQSAARRSIRLRSPLSGARSLSASPDGKYIYTRTGRVGGDLWLATLSR